MLDNGPYFSMEAWGLGMETDFDWLLCKTSSHKQPNEGKELKVKHHARLEKYTLKE